MRRLMFVTQTHTAWGGMEWFVHHMAERLSDRGWEVYAGLARGARYSDPAAYSAAHPHLRAIEMDGRDGTETARRNAVVRAVRRVDPEVVIPIGIGSSLDAMRVLKNTGFRGALVVPVLSLFEDWLANVSEYGDVIDLVVPNSRLLERYLVRHFDASRVRYIRQGVPRATQARSPRREKLHAGIVSRLEESSKRVLDFAAVARLLNGADVELHVFGDGPDRGRLLDALDGRAVDHGFLPTAELYREAYPHLDVLLFFSPTEGSPNSLYEAMQNGVVPVSSRFRGARAEGILKDGENALLFDVGDSATAAQHTRLLASDRARLERMSAATVESVRDYSDDDMYESWARAIESVRPVAGPPLPPRPVAPAGKLERARIPSLLARPLRRIIGRASPHKSGWEEWPGSQPVSSDAVLRIREELNELER
ncbi:MAG TPA: glycosyltransferase family 4 protein [Thermoanaerobaculia bacterium]